MVAMRVSLFFIAVCGVMAIGKLHSSDLHIGESSPASLSVCSSDLGSDSGSNSVSSSSSDSHELMLHLSFINDHCSEDDWFTKMCSSILAEYKAYYSDKNLDYLLGLCSGIRSVCMALSRSNGLFKNEATAALTTQFFYLLYAGLQAEAENKFDKAIVLPDCNTSVPASFVVKGLLLFLEAHMCSLSHLLKLQQDSAAGRERSGISFFQYIISGFYP